VDLVLSACVGYPARKVRPFVESLRRWYSGEAACITANLPEDTKALFRRYDIREYEITLVAPPVLILFQRFFSFRNVLASRPEVDRAFLLDIRDVYFQADPFPALPAAPLAVFLEEETIGNCETNSRWIESLYGAARLADMKGHVISCAGTTAGTRAGLLDYLGLMCAEIHKATKRSVYMGCDQGMHNHLLDTALKDARRVPNRTGAVQTLQYQKEFLFDGLGRLLNLDRTICPVLHQIDRHPQFFDAWGINAAEYLQ
jgi:hypothetical protein